MLIHVSLILNVITATDVNQAHVYRASTTVPIQTARPTTPYPFISVLTPANVREITETVKEILPFVKQEI